MRACVCVCVSNFSQIEHLLIYQFQIFYMFLLEYLSYSGNINRFISIRLFLINGLKSSKLHPDFFIYRTPVLFV